MIQHLYNHELETLAIAVLEELEQRISKQPEAYATDADRVRELAFFLGIDAESHSEHTQFPPVQIVRPQEATA
jgi:hypothetical protein